MTAPLALLFALTLTASTWIARRLFGSFERR